MNTSGYLIDTHILLWELDSDDRLSDKHFKLLTSNVRKFVSVASIWEIAIKVGTGKLIVSPGLLEFIEESDVSILPISPEHALAVSNLPQHHRDPFDRMLVAQAQIEKLTIITMDKHIRLYDVETV